MKSGEKTQKEQSLFSFLVKTQSLQKNPLETLITAYGLDGQLPKKTWESW